MNNTISNKLNPFDKFGNFLILFFIFSYIPFYLMYESLTIWYVFPIHLFVMFFFILRTNIKYGNQYFIIFILIAYALYNFIVSKNYLIFLSEAVIVYTSQLIYFYLKENELRYLSLIKSWIIILYIICIIGIIAHLLFYFIPGFFPFINERTGYSRFEIVYLGRFFYSLYTKFRYASFFSEPSYLGFFAGINVLFILLIPIPVFKRYLLVILILLLGISSFSNTYMISIGIVLAYYLITLIIPKKNHFTLFVIVLVVSSLFLIINYNEIENRLKVEEKGISSKVFDNDRKTSLGDRTNKIEMGLNILNEESILEMFPGKGVGYTILTYNSGQSNGHLLILTEYGIIGYVLLILFLISQLKNNIFLLMFILISLWSIICVISPYFLITIIMFGLSKKLTN